MVGTLVAEEKILQRNMHRNDELKLLALLTMLIDHIGYMFFPHELLFRVIGRLAFPIFAYQIAVGYSHTSNLKKYALRISIFALITQIPYSIFNPNLEFSPIHFNVLFTFAAAVGMLCVYDIGVNKIRNFIKAKDYISLFCGIALLALTAIIVVLPEVISFYVKGFYMEYGMLAMALILFFYIFREKPAAAIISVTLLYLFHGYYRVALYNSAYSSALFWSNLFNYKYVWSQLDLHHGLLQLQRYYFNSLGVFALIPIFILETINIGWIKLNKYVGYVFYPAHMALLVVIAIILKIY